jgi:hypothetical protein
VAVCAAKHLHRRPVGGESIGDEFIRHIALAREKLPQQFQRGLLAAPLLDEDIEDRAFLVDGAPNEHAADQGVTYLQSHG